MNRLSKIVQYFFVSRSSRDKVLAQNKKIKQNIIKSRNHKQSGFTLVELVVGVVITAIALTFLTNIFFANPGRSVEPLLQIRATEFGRAIMEEILAKNFDENTPVGGVPPCSPSTTTCSVALGSEEGSDRTIFDDVDDYDFYCDDVSPGNVIDSLGNDLTASSGNFSQFRMSICVVEGSDTNEKLITVNMYLFISGTLSAPISFAAYKGNY